MEKNNKYTPDWYVWKRTDETKKAMSRAMNLPIKVYILTGAAGVGKDTYATNLLEMLGGTYTTTTLAYADMIKEVANSVGWNGYKDERGRRLLQHLGDVINEYDEDAIIKNLIKRIEKAITNASFKITNFIITDARYDKEVEAIKYYFENWYTNSDVQVLKLQREFSSNLTTELKQHPTEAGISEHLITRVVEL
jgi:hypothetical protein